MVTKTLIDFVCLFRGGVVAINLLQILDFLFLCQTLYIVLELMKALQELKIYKIFSVECIQR